MLLCRAFKFGTTTQLKTNHHNPWTRIQSCALSMSLSALTSSNEEAYVISSASRGLGMEFTKQLLQRTNGKIIGLHRSPSSLEVSQLQQQFPSRFFPVSYDLEDELLIEKAMKEVAALTDRVDLLLNVAGILGDPISPTNEGPERSLSKLNKQWLQKTFDINLFGHVIVTQQLLPLLQVPKNSSRPTAKVVNISARVGSIGDNNLGGWYSYRMSKAALNMFTKTLSIEFNRYNSIALSLHPGTVDTDLSAPFTKNKSKDKIFSATQSVSMMLDVIWKSNKETNGSFFAYDGSTIEW